jgi:hypothetical protein
MDNCLNSLTERQQGLVSRAQLQTCGVTRDELRWRLGRIWRAVHPGVVATFTGCLSPHQQLIAAQLYAGPHAYLSSWTAASWYGVETAREPSIIRLTVPAHLTARRSGPVHVSRTTRVDQAVQERGPLRIGSRARAVIDAAREVKGARRAQAIVIEAVQRRIVPVEDLRHELEAGPRRGSGQVRRAVWAAEAGAWSVPEADLLDLLAESEILPLAWGNPALTAESGERLPTPDAWLDDVGLAVQVHSRAFHARDSDWEATVSGDSLLSEHGVVVIGVTPTSLTTNRDSVKHRVERAYLAVRDRPRPRVYAVPRTALRSNR